VGGGVGHVAQARHGPHAAAEQVAVDELGELKVRVGGHQPLGRLQGLASLATANQPVDLDEAGFGLAACAQVSGHGIAHRRAGGRSGLVAGGGLAGARRGLGAGLNGRVQGQDRY
jgi:hypothetical protein